VRRVAERVSTATWPQWRIYDRAQGLSVVWLSWSMVQTLHSHAGENVATAPLALRAVATPSESRAMAGPIRTHEWRPSAGPRTDLDAISPTLRSISRPRPSHSVLTLHGRAMWKLVMHVVRERLQRRTLFALPGRRDQQASRRLCRTPASERWMDLGIWSWRTSFWRCKPGRVARAGIGSTGALMLPFAPCTLATGCTAVC